MNLNNEEYIILELIPTAISPQKGDIAQLSALKVNGIKIIDRFDYRLDKDKIQIPSFLEMLSYDNDKFTYKNTTQEILDDFLKWSDNKKLLIMDNLYTNNFLETIPNTKESIAKYLDMEYTDDFISKLITKYNLEESNYIVDLLYESLINML